MNIRGRREEDPDNLEVKLPFVSVIGSSRVMLPLLLVVCLFVLGYLIEKHDAESKARQTTTMETISSAQRETVYILSLPQEQREKLHLDMPESLRARIHLERNNP